MLIQTLFPSHIAIQSTSCTPPNIRGETFINKHHPLREQGCTFRFKDVFDSSIQPNRSSQLTTSDSPWATAVSSGYIIPIPSNPIAISLTILWIVGEAITTKPDRYTTPQPRFSYFHQCDHPTQPSFLHFKLHAQGSAIRWPCAPQAQRPSTTTLLLRSGRKSPATNDEGDRV